MNPRSAMWRPAFLANDDDWLGNNWSCPAKLPIMVQTIWSRPHHEPPDPVNSSILIQSEHHRTTRQFFFLNASIQCDVCLWGLPGMALLDVFGHFGYRVTILYFFSDQAPYSSQRNTTSRHPSILLFYVQHLRGAGS